MCISIKYCVLSLLTTALLTFSSYQKEPPSSTKHNSIVILFENDVHCAIEGYPRIAGLRDAVADTAWTSLVTSGDFLQGNTAGAISHGQYIIDIMRTMHYDVIGLGNHEFDYGIPRMQELLNDFNAPVVCCNLTDKAGTRLYAPYTIISYGNRRVAFVGVLTPETELSSEWYSFHDEHGFSTYSLHVNEYTSMVQQAVDNAREDGVDYVVLLSHLGEYNESYQFTSNELIAATHGIDAVLDAHSHNVVDTVLLNSQGKPVLLANTGTQFSHVGKLWIGDNGSMNITLIPTGQIAQESFPVRDAVEQVEAQVREQTNQVIAHSTFPILINDGSGNRMVRKAETNAGDLSADALRWLVDADIGFINGGGIRLDIPAGDITYGDIVSLLPFDNYVLKVQATGAQILHVLQQCTSTLPLEDGDFPQVSGLKFTVTVADHSVSNVMVLQPDGTYAPISETATYSIAASDYIITGGGFYGLMASFPVLQYTTTLYRDALAQYLSSVLHGTVSQQYASPQGRITVH